MIYIHDIVICVKSDNRILKSNIFQFIFHFVQYRGKKVLLSFPELSLSFLYDVLN